MTAETAACRGGRSHAVMATLLVMTVVWCCVPPGTGPAHAQDDWNPFAEQDRERAKQRARRTQREGRQQLEPFGSGETPWRRQNTDRGSTNTDAANRDSRYLPPPRPGEPAFSRNDNAVQRRELDPIIVPSATAPPAADVRPPAAPRGALRQPLDVDPAPGRDRGSGVTSPPGTPGRELWPDLTRETLQRHLKLLPGTVPSPTLARLWTGVASGAPLGATGGGQVDEVLAGLNEDRLYAHGLLKRSSGPFPAAQAQEPVVKTVLARSALLSGDDAAACPVIRQLLSTSKSLPKPLFAELLVLGGVCAIVTGNPSGAALAARLARDAGHPDTVSVRLLEAFQSDRTPRVPSRARLSGIDAAILVHHKSPPTSDIVRQSRPSALAVIAVSDTAPPALRIAAAERAAVINAIDTADLIAAYRSARQLKLADAATPTTRRARQWLAIEDNRAFIQRARNVRAYLDSARNAGLYLAALKAAATVLDELPQVAEIGWFAETAVEIALAGDRPRLAATWADFADRRDGRQSAGFDRWRALIDIAAAEPISERGAHLVALERLALARPFNPAALHRLATVLDALNYQVPIGLWNAASATPQPTTGHLPPTGVLRELSDSARAGAVGPTVLLAIATLGADGPARANILALGDTIRALNRVGLRADARRVAFEALFPIWPRDRTN